MKKTLVSICVPVLNEESNISELIERIQSIEQIESSKYKFEIIFTDNDSNDSTWERIKELSRRVKNIKGVRFTKNIGHQKSIFMNFSISTGRAVIQMDADLQDPPELISDFLRRWEQGYKVVSGFRVDRDENLFKKNFRRIGYTVIDILSDHPITRNVGDFRLLDREVVDEILKLRSPEPFLRGMISKLGYEESLVHYIRPKRKLGNSKFGFRELVTLGFRGVLNNSTIALKASILIGVIWILLAVVGTVSFISMKILSFPLPDGLVTLIVVNFVGFGINSLMLGTLGLYVSRITAIVSNEPMAIFSDRLNVRESLTKERGHEKYKL